MNTLAYIDIARRLREKVPGIKMIDLYNGQFENPEKHLVAAYPAVYVEFLPTEWKTLAAGLQQGTGGVRIFCVMKHFTDTANIDLLSQPLAEARLAWLLFESAVHAALQGFAPSGFTALQRTSSLPDSTFSSIFVVVHEYQADVLDSSAHAYQQWLQIPVHDFPTSGHLSP